MTLKEDKCHDRENKVRAQSKPDAGLPANQLRKLFMGKKNDLSGQRFGKLIAISETSLRANSGAVIWSCVCECGNSKNVTSTGLKNGSTQSCGCLFLQVAAEKGRAKFIHGMTNTSTYRSWCGAKSRCTNPKNAKFHAYGGRGISICKRWADSFEAFLEDMGPTPAKGMSLERLDVNGNYEPGNCCWATQREQQNNRRNNVIISLNGESLTMAEYCRKHSLNSDKVHQRLKRGYSVERAVQP